ncbi:MAG TPA: hypothetical protein VGR07_15805 [Thermoanaerobaculia bacterium]|nr:hypothetical protein [Thermoanaerobaculia bacterium]
MNGLLVAVILVAWGSQAVAPWRLRRSDSAARRLWGHAALPLLLAGALAGLLYVHDRPDAAIAAGLSPLLANLPGRLLALLLAALLGADLILALGKGRIENLGWPLAASLSLLFLAAAALPGELLRVGEGPRGPLPLLFAAALCRLLVTLGAGEAVAAGRPLLAGVAGLALPLYYLCLPTPLKRAIAASGSWLTLGAATVLFLTARWLPASLRRPTVIAAALLAGLFLAQAGDLSQVLPTPPLPPMPPLPGP